MAAAAASSAASASSASAAPAVIQIRKPAPAFVADILTPGGDFAKLNFPSAYAGKYVVLFFYPLDFTFVCPTEIIDFSENAEAFKKLNCEVVAASVDSLHSHFNWVQTPRKQGGLGKMNIPIVSDLTHAVSKAYNVYCDDVGHTIRGLFIIDDKGIVRHATLNDFPVGRNVQEILRLVQAFQFTDKHGEVCPSGWTPGAATIVATQSDKGKYFEKAAK